MMLGDRMLVKFSVKNYKNFKNEIVLDFNTKRDYQFNKKCIKNNLLNKIIIFGKNGVGKSNIGYALFDIVGTLTDKMTDSNQENNFLNADADSEVAEFYYEFKFGDNKIIYKYQKTEFKKIIFEELYLNDEKIFDYDFKNKKMSNCVKLNLIGANTLNFEYYESNMAILKYIVNNTIQTENSVIRQLMQFVTKMLWFRSLKDNRFIGLENESVNVSDWIVKNNLIKEFKTFLFENASLNLDLGSAKLVDKNVLLENHKNFPLVWESVASSGSSALLIYFYWYKHFEDVKFLFIDEFDAFYHFELSKKVIENIINHENMQTILTSHNTYLVNNELLRPDCYFRLDKGKLVSFADSTEREIREGHNLEKMLRQGEFDE